MLKLHRLLPCIVVSLLAVGCAGPERKLGRGLRNVTEFARGGEISRSVEQTTLWEGTQSGVTTGFIRGFNRSMARTLIGAAEVATFFAPWPDGSGEWTYDPVLTPDGPLYPDYSMATYTDPWGGLRLPAEPGTPDSYHHNYPAISAMDTDTELGVTGGSILPFFPFGKFTINEQ